MNTNDRYVGQDLIWVETVAMLSTNPQAARPGDAIAARDGQANWETFQVRLLDALLEQHRLLWPETHKDQ